MGEVSILIFPFPSGSSKKTEGPDGRRGPSRNCLLTTWPCSSRMRSGCEITRTLISDSSIRPSSTLNVRDGIKNLFGIITEQRPTEELLSQRGGTLLQIPTSTDTITRNSEEREEANPDRGDGIPPAGWKARESNMRVIVPRTGSSRGPDDAGWEMTPSSRKTTWSPTGGSEKWSRESIVPVAISIRRPTSSRCGPTSGRWLGVGQQKSGSPIGIGGRGNGENRPLTESSAVIAAWMNTGTKKGR